jgi:hypothetical protein
LSRSSFSGEPLRFCLKRQSLARVLQLGFNEVLINNPDTAIWCQSDSRTYVCMPLNKESAVEPTDKALRITSDGNGQSTPTTVTTTSQRRTKTVDHPQTNTAPVANGDLSTGTAVQQPTANGSRKRKSKSTGLAALIEEAEALKNALRDTGHRAHELVVALKRHRKQSQLVQTSLRALKDLQSVE